MTNFTKDQLDAMARNERHGRQAEHMRRLFNNAIWMFENNNTKEGETLEAKAFAILEAIQKERREKRAVTFITLVETDHIHDAEGVRVREGDDVSCHSAGTMAFGLVVEVTDVDVVVEWASPLGVQRVNKDIFENYCRVTVV